MCQLSVILNCFPCSRAINHCLIPPLLPSEIYNSADMSIIWWAWQKYFVIVLQQYQKVSKEDLSATIELLEKTSVLVEIFKRGQSTFKNLFLKWVY